MSEQCTLHGCLTSLINYYKIEINKIKKNKHENKQKQPQPNKQNILWNWCDALRQKSLKSSTSEFQHMKTLCPIKHKNMVVV